MFSIINSFNGCYGMILIGVDISKYNQTYFTNIKMWPSLNMLFHMTLLSVTCTLSLHHLNASLVRGITYENQTFYIHFYPVNVIKFFLLRVP